MQLIPFRVAGGGGNLVYLNPEQVICLMEAGAGRTQVVTTGLSGAASITLIVDASLSGVAEQMQVARSNGLAEAPGLEPPLIDNGGSSSFAGLSG